MNFDTVLRKILEDFNISPYSQSAPSVGPDIQMTKGDINNTFPSKISTVKLKLPKKKIKKKINLHFLKKNALL